MKFEIFVQMKNLIIYYWILTSWMWLLESQNSDEAPLVVIYSMVGETAKLPCKIADTRDDPIVLILWYKKGIKTPVFSVDSRNKKLSQGTLWSQEDIFGGRSSFGISQPSFSFLIISNTTFTDKGLFTCRVDYKTTQTHIGKVKLHVIEPPKAVKIFSADNVPVEGFVSSQEGRPLTLRCKVSGGVPTPNVTWWLNGSPYDNTIDASYERPADGRESPLRTIENIFHKSSLSRDIFYYGNLTCSTYNNPKTFPLSSSVQLVPVDELKFSVTLMEIPGPLIGGRDYDFRCRGQGVQPPPVITWILGGTILKDNIVHEYHGPDSITSTLSFHAMPEDDMRKLECYGKSPTLPHLNASESMTLKVFYVPKVGISVSEGSVPRLSKPVNARPDEISEFNFDQGVSLTFSCETDANPPTYNVTFFSNGRTLYSTDRIVLRSHSFTIHNLTFNDAGLYTCLASNFVGDSQSNAISLHVRYPPICNWSTPMNIYAILGETITLDCHFSAWPKHLSFSWLVSTKEPQVLSSILKHQDNEASSTSLLPIVNTTDGYTVQCSASNDVGRNIYPCIFDIKVVELPGPLFHCEKTEITSYSASVSCLASNTTDLPQQFHLKILDLEYSEVVSEIESLAPSFSVPVLSPGKTFAFEIFATNAKGKGPSVVLDITTLNPHAEEVAPEEVIVNPHKESRYETVSQKMKRFFSDQVLASVGAGLLTGVIIGMLILGRRKCSRNENVHTQNRHESNTSSSNEFLLKSVDTHSNMEYLDKSEGIQGAASIVSLQTHAKESISVIAQTNHSSSIRPCQLSSDTTYNTNIAEAEISCVSARSSDTASFNCSRGYGLDALQSLIPDIQTCHNPRCPDTLSALNTTQIPVTHSARQSDECNIQTLPSSVPSSQLNSPVNLLSQTSLPISNGSRVRILLEPQSYVVPMNSNSVDTIPPPANFSGRSSPELCSSKNSECENVDSCMKVAQTNIHET